MVKKIRANHFDGRPEPPAPMMPVKKKVACSEAVKKIQRNRKQADRLASFMELLENCSSRRAGLMEDGFDD